jgi:hypothetical protein
MLTTEGDSGLKSSFSCQQSQPSSLEIYYVKSRRKLDIKLGSYRLYLQKSSNRERFEDFRDSSERKKYGSHCNE